MSADPEPGTRIVSFISTTLLNTVCCHPCYRCGSGSSKECSNLPKVTQLLDVVCWTLNSNISRPCHPAVLGSWQPPHCWRSYPKERHCFLNWRQYLVGTRHMSKGQGESHFQWNLLVSLVITTSSTRAVRMASGDDDGTRRQESKTPTPTEAKGLDSLRGSPITR